MTAARVNPDQPRGEAACSSCGRPRSRCRRPDPFLSCCNACRANDGDTHNATPGASRDTAEELREQIAVAIWVSDGMRAETWNDPLVTDHTRDEYRGNADAVLALPSVRRLLDAEARAQAAEAVVQRVREVRDALAETVTEAALDGARPVIDARVILHRIRVATGQEGKQ